MVGLVNSESIPQLAIIPKVYAFYGFQQILNFKRLCDMWDNVWALEVNKMGQNPNLAIYFKTLKLLEVRTSMCFLKTIMVMRCKRYIESSFSLLFRGNYLQKKALTVKFPGPCFHFFSFFSLVSILIKLLLFLLNQGETDKQRGTCYQELSIKNSNLSKGIVQKTGNLNLHWADQKP